MIIIIATNTLLCLSRSSSEMKWEELLPPMPTAWLWSAAVTTQTHLIVAGGKAVDGALVAVETLDTNTFQWSSVSSLPKPLEYPNMTLCNGQLYVSQHNKILSCSLEELLKFHKPASTKSGDGDSVWTKLANIPTSYWVSLTTLRGQVLAMGGSDQLMWGTPTGAIHHYRSINSWSAIGDIPTPRVQPLVAVLPSHELIVVGGYGHAVTEIAPSTH